MEYLHFYYKLTHVILRVRVLAVVVFCDKLHLKFSKFVGICLIGLQPKGFLAI